MWRSFNDKSAVGSSPTRPENKTEYPVRHIPRINNIYFAHKDPGLCNRQLDKTGGGCQCVSPWDCSNHNWLRGIFCVVVRCSKVVAVLDKSIKS